jgi:hypothetical protein
VRGKNCEQGCRKPYGSVRVALVTAEHPGAQTAYAWSEPRPRPCPEGSAQEHGRGVVGQIGCSRGLDMWTGELEISKPEVLDHHAD